METQSEVRDIVICASVTKMGKGRKKKVNKNKNKNKRKISLMTEYTYNRTDCVGDIMWVIM